MSKWLFTSIATMFAMLCGVFAEGSELQPDRRQLALLTPVAAADLTHVEIKPEAYEHVGSAGLSAASPGDDAVAGGAAAYIFLHRKRQQQYRQQMRRTAIHMMRE